MLGKESQKQVYVKFYLYEIYNQFMKIGNRIGCRGGGQEMVFVRRIWSFCSGLGKWFFKELFVGELVFSLWCYQEVVEFLRGGV